MALVALGPAPPLHTTTLTDPEQEQMHPTQHIIILNQMGVKIDRAANTCAVVTNAASRRSRNPLQVRTTPELLHQGIVTLQLHIHARRSLCAREALANTPISVPGATTDPGVGGNRARRWTPTQRPLSVTLRSTTATKLPLLTQDKGSK
jgi:hypothetical protein